MRTCIDSGSRRVSYVLIPSKAGLNADEFVTRAGGWHMGLNPLESGSQCGPLAVEYLLACDRLNPLESGSQCGRIVLPIYPHMQS